MLRVFADTSVLFAAVYSATGFAREMVILATKARLQIVLSQDVIDEIERNLKRKAPGAMPAWRALLDAIDPEIIPPPSAELIKAAARYTEPKDAPIIAAALIAGCKHVVTYDRKHLLLRPEVAGESGLEIVTPDVVVRMVRD